MRNLLRLFFLFAALTILGQAAFGQIMTSSANIFINSGGILHVNGSFENEDTLQSQGLLSVVDSLQNGSGGLIATNDTVLTNIFENNGQVNGSNAAIFINAILLNNDTIALENFSSISINGALNPLQNAASGVIILLDSTQMEITSVLNAANNGRIIIDSSDLNLPSTSLTNNGFITNRKGNIEVGGITNNDTIIVQEGGQVVVSGSFTNDNIASLVRLTTLQDTLVVFSAGLSQNNGRIENGGVILSNNSSTSSFDFSSGVVRNQGLLGSLGGMRVQDSLINEGVVFVTSNIAVNGTGVFENRGDAILSGDFIVSGSFSEYIPDTGAIIFENSTPSDLDLGGAPLAKLILENTANVDITGSFSDTLIILDSLVFRSVPNGGNLVANGRLILDSGVVIRNATMDAANGYVIGSMIRRDTGSLFFPLGDPLVYRPASLLNVPTVDGGLAPRVEMALIPFVNTVRIDSSQFRGVSNRRLWIVGTNGDTLDGALFQASAYRNTAIITGDSLGTDLSRVLIGRANNATDTLRSIGSSAFTGDLVSGAPTDPSATITSAASISNGGVFALGESENSKVDLRVFLEGGSPNGSSMVQDAGYKSVLDTFYTSGGSAPIRMLEGYSVPANAIDVVYITLRTTPNNPATDLETQPAWLLEDGSIRDFYTGEIPYLTFAGVAGGNYYLNVKHRNHLSVGSNNLVTAGTADPITPYDLTTAGNIFGIGFKNVLGDAVMVAGNTDTSNQLINVFDYLIWQFFVSVTPSFSLEFQDEDVNLDGFVQTGDGDIISNNNDIGYFSTVD